MVRGRSSWRLSRVDPVNLSLRWRQPIVSARRCQVTMHVLEGSRILRPLLASLATRSAAEAGTPPNLYSGRLSFKRIGPDGPIWILGEFENKPGSVRVAFQRSSSPLETSERGTLPSSEPSHEAGKQRRSKASEAEGYAAGASCRGLRSDGIGITPTRKCERGLYHVCRGPSKALSLARRVGLCVVPAPGKGRSPSRLPRWRS